MKQVVGLVLAAAVAASAFFSKKNSAPGTPPSTSSPTVATAPAQPVSVGMARVVRIADGDTLTVAIPKEGKPDELVEEKVRLLGINTPESNRKPGTPGPFTPEPYSLEAKQYLTERCPVGSTFKIEFHGRDKYGRMLGVVFLPDGREVNELLLDAGLAKVFMLTQKKYGEMVKRYEAAQTRAQQAHVGIWKNH